MAFDGIVTKCVVNELNSFLIDGKINKIFEPNKNEIILGIYAGGKNYALNICIDALNYRISLTTHNKPNPINALNFCMLLRKHILGYKIKSISNIDLERIVFIELEGYNELNDLTNKKLIIELMGKHSNVILLNENDYIIDALRHLDITSNSNRDIMPARKYIFPNSKKYSILELDNFDDFYKIIIDSKFNRIDDAISSNFTGISKIFIQRLLIDLNLDNVLNKDNLFKIFSYIQSIFLNLNNVRCKIILINNNNQEYVPYISENDNDLNINFFLDDFYFNKQQKELLTTYRNSILKLILSYLKKYKNRLKKIDNKLSECKNMDTYKLYGELITANLYNIKDVNSEEIELKNYYDNNNLISIPLDKKFSIPNNAKIYFKKYNKLKNALEICSKQKAETEKELNYIESVIYELENSESINDLNTIYSEISENDIFKDSFNKKKNNKKNPKVNLKTSLNPIELNVDGYTVLIGKNNICNDNLTTKIANKNDLWFHTKDIHGSHVVLKSDDKSFNEDIILKCAQIAAYHSKAKLSSNVPVDYCYIKYVKKPHKSKPGMVIYSHNKTLFVNPKNQEMS